MTHAEQFDLFAIDAAPPVAVAVEIAPPVVSGDLLSIPEVAECLAAPEPPPETEEELDGSDFPPLTPENATTWERCYAEGYDYGTAWHPGDVLGCPYTDPVNPENGAWWEGFQDGRRDNTDPRAHNLNPAIPLDSGRLPRGGEEE